MDKKEAVMTFLKAVKKWWKRVKQIGRVLDGSAYIAKMPERKKK